MQSPTHSSSYTSPFAFFILPLSCLSSSFHSLVCMHPCNLPLYLTSLHSLSYSSRFAHLNASWLFFTPLFHSPS
jgi:hypothetical protein